MSGENASVADAGHSPSRTVIMLAWPVLLEQLMVSLVGYIDTAMVGSLGKNATAAVGISNPPMFLINGIIMALGIGFTAHIARAAGAQDTERAKRLMRQALLAVAAIGIPLSIAYFLLARQIPAWMQAGPEILDMAAAYNRIVAAALMFRTLTMILTALFRGCGDTRTPMYINIAINIINVAGNFLLIFPTRELSVLGLEITMPGAGWGVAGAAAATSGSGIVGALALLGVTFFKKGPMQLPIKGDYRPDWTVLRSVLRVSLPTALENITMSSASILTTRTIASLGTASVAAHQLALTGESISFMPAFAFGAAATTLAGQALGAAKPELAERYVKTTVKIAAAVMLICGLLLFIFSARVLRIFTPDEDVIAIGTNCLRLSALIQIPQAISAILAGGMRGAGDTKWPFIIISLSMWLIRMPVILVSIKLMSAGIIAVYIAMDIDICARCTGMFMRYRTGKWKTDMRS